MSNAAFRNPDHQDAALALNMTPADVDNYRRRVREAASEALARDDVSAPRSHRAALIYSRAACAAGGASLPTDVTSRVRLEVLGELLSSLGLPWRPGSVEPDPGPIEKVPGPVDRAPRPGHDESTLTRAQRRNLRRARQRSRSAADLPDVSAA